MGGSAPENTLSTAGAAETWSDTVVGLEDLPRLTRYLAVRLPGSIRPPLRAMPLPGGRSNLSYELCDGDGRVLVLRRPPLPLGPGGHLIGQRGVWRFVRQILLAGEESHVRPPF